ncbi:MAG: histidine triad nucleotide-binding protein [Methylococcaceae bacterium]|nr:histidine triad nucleotide-binding protein [Methylococcaceae bacterium]MCI0733949.1 histidine triad nucleotide-binding protein [Methylococcaceae bacterium]
MVKREINPDVVFENDEVLAFRDIHPKAPVHVLVIPKRHIETLDELDDQTLAGELLLSARRVAGQLGLSKGYRVAINCKSAGGQEVYHLHLHILGGRQLTWPPG